MPVINEDGEILTDKRIAVELAADVDVLETAAKLVLGDLVLLRLDVFSDGRAFSQARLLRVRLNFRGDIRAVGDVVPDQIEFMQRCGINQFELKNDRDVSLARKILGVRQSRYQDHEGLPKAC